jgi:hypothetical protein
MTAALRQSVIHIALSLHAEKTLFVAMVEGHLDDGIGGLVEDNDAGGSPAHDIG